MALRISKDLSLPIDVAGEAVAILAKRGAGKTNTGRVLAEELNAAGVQIVVLDPVGAWWGLRSSADGKQAGLALPVLGGAHGDVPLEANAGHLIADVVVDTGHAVVLDLSDFPKTQQRQFVTDFAERFYQRKAREKTLIHVILEEADEFVPQRVSRENARMVGAIEQLVRRGRGRGIGLTMISQRSASLNKAVLEQADVLIAMRNTGPRDRAAIEAWVSKQDVEDADLVLPSLPSLETGEAWIWNPERGLLQRVRIRLAETFDSSQTPKAGEQRAAPKQVAAIDLAQLGEKIAATAERAKENDPAELRKRIRELERRPDAGERVVEKVVEVEKTVEVPLLTDADRALLEGARNFAGGLVDELEKLSQRLEALSAAKPTVRPAPAARARAPRPEPAPRPAPTPRVAAESNGSSGGDVSRPQQKILDALAWFEAIGVSEPRRPPLAAVAGVSSKSSGFRANLSTLSGKGLVLYASGGRVYLSDDGRELAQPPAIAPTTEDLHDAIYRMISGPQATLLQQLVHAYPGALEREQLAEAAGVSPASSGFRANVSTLSGFELVTYPTPGTVAAAPLLFPEDDR